MTEYVGKPILRYDGIGHVTGRTVYVDDIQRPGMLYIKVLTSPVHKGVIRRLDVSAAEKMAGVAGVITAKDVPGINAYGLIPDQPVFTPEHIRFKGERIAAVAAVDEDTADGSAGKDQAGHPRSRPRSSTPLRPCSRALPWFGPRATSSNSTAGKPARSGSATWRRASKKRTIIVEGKYTNCMNEHAPIEPQVSVAYLDESRPAGHPHGQPGSLLPPGDADRHLQPTHE